MQWDYFQIHKSINLLDDSLQSTLKIPDLMYNCIIMINYQLEEQNLVPAYEVRLTSIAGPMPFNPYTLHPLSKFRLMHGTDVERMRIEIHRYGSGSQYGDNGIHTQYGTDGMDRYTVGEYEFGVSDSHCLIFKLPCIIQNSNHDSVMFLNKGWASMLMHMRVLISCMLQRKFEITCVNEITANILRKYSGLCIIEQINEKNVTFTFDNEFNVVAHKALFLVMSKIANPKSIAMYQSRINGLADTRDQYRDLIV